METTRGPINGETKNISIDGAYIYCEWIPEPGEVVTVTIKPPDKSTFQVKAEIIWIGLLPQVGGGIAFTEISEEDIKFIADAVDQNK
jgi:hypothetical protein